MKTRIFAAIAACLMLIFGIALVTGNPDPSGAVVTRGNSSRGTNPSAGTTTAEDGNVTQLNVNGSRVTDVWQGFFGNVSGSIVLQNSGGNNFYDWSLASIAGEIYATRLTVPSWATVNCTNASQWEAEETLLNIPLNETDGVNETYSSTSHPQFQVGTINVSNCRSTRPYNHTAQSSRFWNVLLNSNTTNVVYTALLSDNSNAFDNTTVDFELLVPVDKSAGTATYFFYAELS